MRITTRVSIGLLLMAALLIGTLAYQLSQVQRLQGINSEISQVSVEAARISIGLVQGLDEVLAAANAVSALPADPDYRVLWTEWEGAVEEDLESLSLVGLSQREERVRLRIESGWARYRTLATEFAESPVERFQPVEELLMRVRADAEELITVNRAVTAERAAVSADAADRARTVAWISAGSALLLAALLSFLLYRSISGPLQRLTRGTREIARGRFDHRLKVRGPRELSALARDFDQMAARLDELEDLKRDFLSHVSHELKTPLAAIHETIEILLEEIPGPLTDKQSRLLRLSRTSSNRLSGMISDLLELSRLEAGASGYEPRWHDASRIALSVLEELEPVAEENRLHLALRQRSRTMDFVCDRKRMREVVTNLVSNAVKFSPNGGNVRLVLETVSRIPDSKPPVRQPVDSERGPYLLLSVEDEGPGIADEHKRGIFEKFHQISPGGRHRGQGVGLGLAIARRVVSAHGGGICVEDRAGGGSIFRVIVPQIPSQWRSGFGGGPPGTPNQASSTEESGVLKIRRRPTRIALGILAVLALSACAAAQPEVEPLLEPEVEVVEEPAPPVQAVPPATEVSVAPEELRLSTGWSFLASGEYQSAYDQFEIVIEGGTSAIHTGEAAWGMALLHILPESPLRDPERASLLLNYLNRQFPNRPLGIQARVTLGMLTDLDQIQSMVQEQEAALQQLSDTVDQLKNIDLNRAPARTRVRPDSLPSVIGDP